MIKGSIYQDDITIINIYVSNNRSSRYIKQKLTELKGELENSTIIVADINIPFRID